MTMSILNQRKKNLLKAVVWEFIKTGQPVSSNFLYKYYDFGIKPAMIRNELLELTRENYLFQPYYSSARIPTDLGYELFVKSVLEELDERTLNNIKIDNLIVGLFKNKDWKNLAKRLAEKLKLSSFITDLKSEFVYKEGLGYLIDQIDLESRNQIKKIIQNFENLEEEIFGNESLLREENFIKIFIGKRNPLFKNEYLSVVVGDYKIYKSRILILAIGPKRMDYKKTYFIFRGLKNIKI